MDNRIIAGFVITMAVLTIYATAATYNVEIELNEKQDEWLNTKMNNTGKSAGDVIETDVQEYYDGEYTVDLGDKINILATECKNRDYKIQIECAKALETVLKIKP